jgi:hypothetical protein
MFVQKNNNLILKLSNKFRRNDCNNVYIFTNARDEPNIAEWIAHHLLLGFDKVFVFDHLSIEPIQTKLNTNFDGRLFVERVEGNGNIKQQLMMRAVEICNAHNVSWMLYLDADEFLLLNKLTNVKDFLRIFTNADAVGINWLMFGTSGHIKQPKGLLTNNFTRSNIRLDKHVKSFVRPSTVIRVDNPHFFVIQNPNRYFSAMRTRMPMNPFNNQPLPFVKTIAYIAHYYTQSEEEHWRRKSRALDDGSNNKANSITDVHNLYNEVINTQLQNKYSQHIKDFLQKYHIFHL